MGATGRTRARGGAIAASLAAHVLVLGLLLWRLGTAPPLPEPPVMQVEILRRTSPERPEPPAARPPPSASRRPVPPPVLSRPPPDSAAPSVAAAPEAVPDVRQALRGLVGCQHLRLSAEERERCYDRLGANVAGLRGPPMKLDLDGHGFAADAIPYLARRPHNGCKLMAAGDAGPAGNQGAAAGFACEWDFW